MAEPVDELADVPPDTNLDLQDCSEEEWNKFRELQTLKLMEAEDTAADSVPSVIGSSTVRGLDTVTTASMASMASTLKTGGTFTTQRTISAQSEMDHQDLQKMFNFRKQDFSWKVPIIQFKDKILHMVGGNQIVVLSGPTGCGKSTQVPQYILDQHAMERRNVNIVVTQPRKLAASSLARRVCQEREWELGGLVGYQVGLDKANKGPDTRLLYVTTGVLKKMIIGKKSLDSWTHIILDEVHERNEDMDLILLMCKKFLFTNSKKTKLILMSATLNEQKLRHYFGSRTFPSQLESPAPSLDVGHKKMKAASRFYYDELISGHNLKDLARPDFQVNAPALDKTCMVLAKVLIENMDQLDLLEEGKPRKPGKPGAVLVFLPGINEIQEMRDFLLKDGNRTKKKTEWKIIPLHSSIPWEEHQLVFQDVPPKTRKIVLATTIAESSLTIPDIIYVIDFGLTKNNVADPETNYPMLVLEWACRNQLTQRAGRAGRVHQDGRVFTLLPESFANSLPQEHVPEIQRVPLTKVVLDVKMLGLGSPKEILALAMDAPNIQSLLRSIVTLQEMMALRTTVGGLPSRHDGDLTCLGEIVARLPIDIKLGKLIFLGHVFGVLPDAIIIASGLNGKSIFTAPFDKKVQAYKNKLLWADRTFSDCHAILNAFHAWKMMKDRGDFLGRGGSSREEQFCKTSFLQRKQLQEMERLVEEITKTLSFLHIESPMVQNPVSWDEESKDVALEIVMFGAFYPNYFIQTVHSDVGNQTSKILFGKDPRTTVYLTGMKEPHGEYGEIYAGQIKALFEDCTREEEKIHLTFRGAKILVEFDQCGTQQDRWLQQKSDEHNPEENMTGDILHQVYIAAKLKSLGRIRRNVIKVYDVEEAKAIHEDWEKSIKRVENNKTLSTTNIHHLQPPLPAEEKILIKKFGQISSPSMFWVHYGEDSLDNLERIRVIIQQVLPRCQAVKPRESVKVGQVFLAPDTRGQGQYQQYSRVLVSSSISGHNTVTVFFMDHGNTEFVAIKQLMMIPAVQIREFPELVTIPGQAVECSLSGLQPSKARTVKGLWDDQVVARFKEIKESHIGRDITGRIFSVTRSTSGNGFVVNLSSLEIPTREEEVDVVKQLLQEKLADPAVESLISQEDHKQRLLHNNQGSEGMRRYLDDQYCQTFRLKTEVKVEEESGKLKESVELGGPFTPLENKVQVQYRGGLFTGAKMDPESINSVILDRNLADSHQKWLVAAHVGKTSSGEALGLRNTFWLSSKPGLGALLTMVFAPVVELRLKEGDHQHRRKMTGFIAGMGPKVHWNKTEISRAEATEAFYPEHDMEIKFDINVDIEDIDLINKLRCCLNRMLMKSQDGMLMTQTKALHDTQRTIQSCLKELLEKERRPEEISVPPINQNYRWNMMNPDWRLENRPGDHSSDFWVYSWINGMRPESSRQRKREHQAQVDKVLSLYRQADMFSETALPYHEVCPICPGRLMLNTRRQVYLHLQSKLHQDRENEVDGLQDNVSIASTATSNTFRM